MKRRTFVLAATLSIMLLSYGKPAQTQTRIPAGLHAIQPPTDLPAFNLPDASGNMVRSSDLVGNVLILRFWATWCGFCKTEMPAVQRAYDTFKGQNIKVLAISIDSGGAKDVVAFMRRNNYSMPALLDSRMQTLSRMGVMGIPATFIVDRQGKVVARGAGQVDFDAPEFRDYVERLAK